MELTPIMQYTKTY